MLGLGGPWAWKWEEERGVLQNPSPRVARFFRSAGTLRTDGPHTSGSARLSPHRTLRKPVSPRQGPQLRGRVGEWFQTRARVESAKEEPSKLSEQ